MQLTIWPVITLKMLQAAEARGIVNANEGLPAAGTRSSCEEMSPAKEQSLRFSAGTAEQWWINERKQAVMMTRSSVVSARTR